MTKTKRHRKANLPVPTQSKCKTICYTSVTGSYLVNARILAKSVKQVYPDWEFVLLFNDMTPPGIVWADEPFDHVLFAHHLGISDWKKWAFKYSVIELCTATKGRAAQVLFENFEADRVIYLDPDTVLFSPLAEIDSIFEGGHSVVLTPHLTDPEDEKAAIESHEIAALKHGTFNLGFYAINNTPDGRAFTDWWAARLLEYAHIDFDRGLFTDQKWCNLAPYLFEGIFVLKDRAYNIATWNIKNRTIGRKDGNWLVNDRPVRFYHFSGFGNGFAWAKRELALFASEGDPLWDLWENYSDQYEENRLAKTAPWFWGHFENGQPITPADRKTYFEDEVMQLQHPDPYRQASYTAIRRIAAS